MPAIDFYILPTDSESERLRFACKLAEKAYHNGQKAYIVTGSEALSKKLDDLLWTFRAGSFIPHQINTGAKPATDNMILIGTASGPAPWSETIINLAEHPPDNQEHVRRILEILDASDSCKQAGRSRYRHYQQLNQTITVHNM